jgi:hypothetical protein
MKPSPPSPEKKLRDAWLRLSPLPGGKWLFSKVCGVMIPYTGSIGARVDVLEPGHAEVVLTDRRSVRNHLDSIRDRPDEPAEFTTGLRCRWRCRPRTARSSRASPSSSPRRPAERCVRMPLRIPKVEKHEIRIPVVVRDAAGDIVSKAEACGSWAP